MQISILPVGGHLERQWGFTKHTMVGGMKGGPGTGVTADDGRGRARTGESLSLPEARPDHDELPILFVESQNIGYQDSFWDHGAKRRLIGAWRKKVFTHTQAKKYLII